MMKNVWQNPKKPKFGVLQGVKVVNASMSIAGPFAAQLLADHGADVIWIERASAPDTMRTVGSYCIEMDRKNQRGIALDVVQPEGRKIFLDLLKEADVLIESSKGGQYDKWGLSDEVLWEVNPKLVICHISGWGQTGIPDYVTRPSFDSVAQAYTGLMHANRDDITPPHTIGPYFGDYITAFYTAISILAALHKAKETGIGESIDLAQAEAILRTEVYLSDWFTAHEEVNPTGKPIETAAYGQFLTKDKKYINIGVAGDNIIHRTLDLFGLEYGKPPFDIPRGSYLKSTEGGAMLEAAAVKWIGDHTADEAIEILQSKGIPCAKINTFEDIENDAQVKARDLIKEWDSVKGVHVRGLDVVPRFKNNPGQIWGPAPYFGMDNEQVLDALGYSAEEIEELYKKKVIANDKAMKFQMPLDV
jgi:L-carnitine CoA-transferase